MNLCGGYYCRRNINWISPEFFKMWSILLILLVLSLNSIIVSSQDEFYNTVTSEKREGSKYCGKNLANALRLVCGGFYNSMFKKKSDPDAELLKNLENYNNGLDDGVGVEYPFRLKSHAQGLIGPAGSFRRHARGAYDECCRKSCSVTEMMGYCADRP